MLIWQGLGAYAFVIPFFLWLGSLVAAQAILGAEAAKQNGQWIAGLALIVSGLLIYLMSKRINARPGRVVIDKATGQEITLRERHTMFSVPMRYWAMFWAGLGAILFVLGVASRVAS